jgi:transcriptional regulator with XRE-family HTH domain
MQDKIKRYLNIISKNIRFFREKAGLSQEQLAEKVGCSREFVNRVENGKECFGLKSLLILAVVLNINPKDFFA